MDELDAEFDSPLKLNLCEEVNPEKGERQGGFKSYSVKGDGGVIYYSEKRSNFTILVEKLLCIDGWEGTTETQAMTLLVLQFNLKCTDPDGRFESVVATMEFEDSKVTSTLGKAFPEIEAWAPFHIMQRYNESEGEAHKKGHADLEIGGGAYGFQAKAGAGREREISWTQKFFDEEHATPLPSELDGRRNGVRWYMK